jgi:hypothetical protein
VSPVTKISWLAKAGQSLWSWRNKAGPSPDIAQHQVVGTPVERGEGFLAARRNLDRKPLAGQHLGDGVGDLAFVVDDQNAAPGNLGHLLRLSRQPRLLGCDDRQADRKHRAATGGLVDRDRAAALTRAWQIERPMPVPAPTGLVVKNGSNTRERKLAGIPGPLSLITRRSCDCTGLYRV